MEGTLLDQNDRRVRRERRGDQLRLHARANCLAAALDRLPHPILLVLPGEPVQVWHTNAAARDELAGTSLLRLEQDCLVVPDNPSGRDLVRGIRRAFIRGPKHPQIIELVWEAGSNFTRDIHIEAIDVDMDAGLPVSRVLLLEIEEGASAELALQRLCRDFKLTPTEAETVLSLYARGSAAELARESGKSIHTIRTQLKSAMQKTNTHTQVGLVALVGSRVGNL